MTQQQPFTAPSNAPAAPGQPPLAAGPSQEDRLLAAAAYIGYITGFWLIVPIVVYVLKRDKSRFVAHHAMRALLLHVVAVPVGILGALISLALGIGIMVAVGESRAREHQGAAAGLFALLFYGSWLLPYGIYFIVTVLAAIRAFQGRTSKDSLLGRAAEWFLKQDKGVAPDVSP